MAVSEKIELLGKGLYTDIPDTLTLSSIPTVSELDMVSAEDFETTMLDNVFPKVIAEKIDFRKLLEIDFIWICRALRILSYGPYHTVNAVFCSNCGKTSYGEYTADLRTIDCKALPAGFVNDVVIPADKFVDFDGDIHLSLLTIQDALNANRDTAFQTPGGKSNRKLARMCYMIKSIRNKKNLNPVDVKLMIQNELSAADYILLKDAVDELTDYGMRIGGKIGCPACHTNNGAFVAFVDDKFFRPSVGAIREWAAERNSKSSGTK